MATIPDTTSNPAASPLRLGISGAHGRMGRAVAALAGERSDVTVTLAFDRDETPDLGVCDVIVDFSTPEATTALAAAAAARSGPALVIGSTGLSEAQRAVVAEAAATIPVVFSGNYSLGVNVLLGLVRQAAALLGPDAFDIEIVEAHHRRKVDAPSGTALMLGEAAAEARGHALADLRAPVRDGVGDPRRAGSIGFAALRGGGVIGEHAVIFASDEEILTLAHSARDRSLFARGAVEAAVWVRSRPAGLYDMQDVLGFR